MKRIISAILGLAIITTLLSACSNDNSSSMHTLYFKDSFKSKNAEAIFYNSKNGKSQKVKMKKIGEDKNTFTFSCEGNTSKYNMVKIAYGNKKTSAFTFNKCVSGWHKTKTNLLPYTHGGKTKYFPEFDDVVLKGHGYDKTVHIWKPNDYNSKSKEKYSTIYVLDGQIMTTVQSEDKKRIGGCPVVTEQVNAMNKATGKKAIVVAIDNIVARDYELVPDIGVSMDEKHIGKNITEDDFYGMGGIEFADFVANTLVPYIQKHYNVYKDTLHTSVTGVSLGGLEAFYVAAEYPKVFGTLGAFSPSFWEYDAKTWDKYISKKSFNKKSPFLYFYTGPKKADTEPDVTNMYNRLIKKGYPKNKLALHFNKDGAHSSYCWRYHFSEFLSAMMYQKTEPLQN